MTYTLVFLKVSQGMFIFLILGVRGWTRNIRVAPKLGGSRHLSWGEAGLSFNVGVRFR